MTKYKNLSLLLFSVLVLAGTAVWLSGYLFPNQTSLQGLEEHVSIKTADSNQTLANIQAFKPSTRSDIEQLADQTLEVLETASSDAEGEGSYLTPAEQHNIAKWRESRGHSREQSQIYRAYDRDTLLSLAEQGDIYALQEGSQVMRKELRGDVGYQMLLNAAARGSTQALMMVGMSMESKMDSIRDGTITEEEVRRIYGIELIDAPIEDVLAIMAGANFFTAAMRGNIVMALTHIDVLQSNHLGRDFTEDEVRSIVANAQGLYNDLALIREHLGLDEFDNSYPKEYARHFGLPEENNVLEANLTSLQ